MQISQDIFVHKTIIKDPYGDGSIDQLNEYKVENKSPYDALIEFDISNSSMARLVNQSSKKGSSKNPAKARVLVPRHQTLEKVCQIELWKKNLRQGPQEWQLNLVLSYKIKAASREQRRLPDNALVIRNEEDRAKAFDHKIETQSEKSWH